MSSAQKPTKQSRRRTRVDKIERLRCMCGLKDAECPCGGLFAVRMCEASFGHTCPHCGRWFTQESLPPIRESDRERPAPRRHDGE